MARAVALATGILFCVVLPSSGADSQITDGGRVIRILAAGPSEIRVKPGETFEVTCRAEGTGCEVGSFMLRSQRPVRTTPKGLKRRNDGYVFLADPAFAKEARNMCLADNGALDHDPAKSAGKFVISTAGWMPGVYGFDIVAHIRPAGGAYVCDRREVRVVVEGQQPSNPVSVTPRPQTLALNVDFNCRRDDEPELARFIRACAKRGVTRLNFRALMMGYTEHPSKVRMSWGQAAPDFVDPAFDLFRLAVKYCRETGIECYVFYDLFDTRNDAFAKAHPEFRLVSRDGKSTCQGALSYAYPEVRAYFDRYIDELLDYGVDGFMFCTKSRHGMPLTRKYGFNDPVVAAFSKRHGVDVRTEKYDQDKWLDLQGEYILSWVAETTRRIHARGGQTSITLPSFKRNHYANLDWREVVRQKAVDELHTSCWRSEENQLFGPEGSKRLQEYVRVCHENGVKYSPYLFADMTLRRVYSRSGLDAACEETKLWTRHVRCADIDGIMWHDMDIYERHVFDFVNEAVIRAAGQAMKEPPAWMSGWEGTGANDRRTGGETLFNPALELGEGGMPRCWNVLLPGRAITGTEHGLAMPGGSRIESQPASIARDGKDKDTGYVLRLDMGCATPGQAVRVRLIRPLRPPVDYEIGRHLEHRRQIVVDEMLDQELTVPVGAPRPVTLAFHGGKAQGNRDGSVVQLQVTFPKAAPVTVRSISLKRR
ncbi:MAG: hypothetical protein HN380_21700 [Victivallales bacterium]|nr:hypothetical protein [Victivallales bacterium]